MDPAVSQMYAACRLVHSRYPCISVCISIERLGSYLQYDDVENVVTVEMTYMIDEMHCGYGTLRTTEVRMLHRVSQRVCSVVSAAFEVTH
jgi:hypothetical protein